MRSLCNVGNPINGTSPYKTKTLVFESYIWICTPELRARTTLLCSAIPNQQQTRTVGLQLLAFITTYH